MKSATKTVVPFAIVPLVYTTMLAAVFSEAFRYLWRTWQGEDYTYCWFIAPIALYLIWEKRCELQEASVQPDWSALLPLTGGIVLYLLGELGGEFTLLFFSFWLLIIGLLWLHLGRESVRKIWFPLVLLLAMFPPPMVIHNNLSMKLKLVSSYLGVGVLQVCGMTAYREGNVIDLGFTKLQVVDACSGLRYLIPLIILGTLVAYYHKGPTWQKVAIVVSAIPITIATNGFRIASVGFLFPFFGPQVAEGFFHDFSGWVIFMLSLAVLLLEVRIFRYFAPKAVSGGRTEHDVLRAPAAQVLSFKNSEEVLSASPKQVLGFRTKTGPAESSSFDFRGQVVRFLVASAMLGTVAIVFHSVEFREKVPPVRAFALFPLQIGEWQGQRSQLEQKYLDTLNLSDYLLADYRDPQGKTVNLYVAFNDSQRKGQATHSPASCLPGSGWVFEKSGTVAVPNGTGDMTVSRALMQKTGESEVMYYWFPQRGRVLNSMLEIKLYNFWDALTRHRTDGALVRITTPVYQGESVDAAEARLRRFTSVAAAELRGFLPE